jgi:hypothetical protein
MKCAALVHSNLLKADLVLALSAHCCFCSRVAAACCTCTYKLASSWGCWKCVTLFNKWRTIKKSLELPCMAKHGTHTGCKLISHVTGMPMEAVERMLEIHSGGQQSSSSSEIWLARRSFLSRQKSRACLDLGALLLELLKGRLCRQQQRSVNVTAACGPRIPWTFACFKRNSSSARAVVRNNRAPPLARRTHTSKTLHANYAD